MKKEELDNILKILAEEAKKIKKRKKKFSPVAISPIRRPMGSIFSMDAAVSMAESEMLNEESAIKPITKKFNHLKWTLNDFQKQFLDDFITVPDEALRKEDYDYASKRTGIPVESIKSIRNTYGQPELGYAKPDVIKGSAFDVGHKGPTAKELGITAKALSTENPKKIIQPNQNPDFRNKSLHQMEYESELSALAGGGLKRISERELPNFMYEWLLYFIEGVEKFNITESKAMNDLNSTMFDKYKFILFSFDLSLKESKAHPYDLASNIMLSQLKEFYEKVKEFNKTFGTNFVVSNQYTGEDGMVKIILENAQTTDGVNVFNKKFVDMSMTDEERQAIFLMKKAMYDE